MTKEEIPEVKKFLIKLFIFLFILFICDRLVGSVLEFLYNHNPQGDIRTFSHSINNPKEDIMIYGSSRAVHTYNCRIIKDSLGLSCFNNGRENSNILYHSTILPWALEKHTPKIIILDVTPKEFTFRSGENAKLVLASMILPYVRRDTQFANIATKLFPRELLKAKVSKLYAYNSLILPIIWGQFTKRKKGQAKDIINGYLPLHGSKITKGLPAYSFNDIEGEDSTAKERFEFFVKTVTEKNIKLFVAIGPIYIQKFPETDDMKEMQEILKKYNVPFWNYSSDTSYLKRENFYDNAHLNDRGAQIFSAEIASKIKTIIQSDSSSGFK